MNNYWQGISGQEAVKNILEKIIFSKKIPHAFLFSGPDGVGKEFIAIRFAQLLNHPSDNETKINDAGKLGYIQKQIENLTEPLIKYIFPLPRGKNETDSNSPTEKLSTDEIQLIQQEIEKKVQNPYYKISVPRASNIKISSIRDIKKFLSFEYGNLKYRVIIISDAHLMNEEAQNALLKSLEEPPDGVIFILVTAFPSMLRETIRSRCWAVNFQPLSDDNLSEALINYYNVDSEASKKIAPFASGSLNNALKLLEHDFDEMMSRTISILRYSFGRKYNSALEEFSPLLSNGNSDSVRLIIQLIISWLNDLQKLKCDSHFFYFNDYKETLDKFNKRFPLINVSNTVFNLDKLSAIIQNNINLNLIALNIIFELSELVASR